jgi:hypothetical protein
MSQNVTLSATISAAQSLMVEALAPRFAAPFALVYRCSKNTSKTAIFAIFWTCGVASGRDGSFGKALRHLEIGHDVCSAGPFETECVSVHPKCHIDFR